jgi:hypothetical protein
MSSHHFVKEGQEPALLIASPVSFESAKGLLEWVPLIMVTSPALEAVLTWGIKIDVVISQPETVSSIQEIIGDAFPFEIVTCDPGEDLIACALRHKNLEVNIITDDAVNLLPAIGGFLDSVHVVLFEGHSKWTFHTKYFKKWVPAGSVLYLYATCKDQQFSVAGAILEGTDYRAERDGNVQFESEFPFWVVEQQIF